MNDSNSLLGVGLYTISEVGRFIRVYGKKDVSDVQIRRWLFGTKKYAPLWESKIDSKKQKIMSFHDMIETKIVKQFIQFGVSAQKMRKVIEILKEHEGFGDYPLSSKRFSTDGKNVMGQDLGGVKLSNVLTKQGEMPEIIKLTFKNIDYGEDDIPQKWWIAGKEKRIVLDPHRSFGKPIDDETRVPTSALCSALKSEGGDMECVAHSFGVSIDVVRQAVDFERQLAA